MYFSLHYDVFLNDIFFFPAYFVVEILYVIPITYKQCANQLLMFSVSLPVNSRLLVVKFWGRQNLYSDF